MENNSTERNYVHQGDLLFIPITKEHFEKQRADWSYSERPITDGILQRGEATGHHHSVVEIEQAEAYRLGYGDGTVVLKVSPKGISIAHQEHSKVQLLPDQHYEMHVDQEHDYLAQISRRVVD